VLFEGAIKHASRSLAELEAWIASKQASPAKTRV
jgi:hypothetical protein